MNIRSSTLQSLCCLLLATAMPALAADSAPRPPPTSMTPAAAGSQKVDARGFIHRWLVLEPIAAGRELTESAVATALQAAALPGTMTDVPRAGAVVEHTSGPLRWHALDTKAYNLNLYHFAWSLNKPTSNVLFWVATVVESPSEMRDVRLAICSNAASQWWLNGEPVIAIYGDRQAVIDDGVSHRLTLRKGRNVIRAAIVNGGGATDFCARFITAEGEPITGLSATLAAQ
jgi:hypothetical protein